MQGFSSSYRGGRAKGAINRLKSAELTQRAVVLVEGNAKRYTPVDTGHLRRSIHHRVLSHTRGIVGTNVSYARPVHEGTRRMRGRPFLVQGLDASRAQIQAMLQTFGQEVLDEFGKEVQARFTKR